MPTFNMAAQTPNGQPGGTEAVYTNGIPQSYPGRKFWIFFLSFLWKWNSFFFSLLINIVYTIDALHLSIPSQGLQNGDAALQHAAAYPGMQPYPGVGELKNYIV